MEYKELVKVVEKIKDSKKKEKKSGIKSILKQRVSSKPILKKSQVSVTIEEREPVEYKSRFFKKEWEATKKSMFLE